MGTNKRMTRKQQTAELVKIDAEITEVESQILELRGRQQALYDRRTLVCTQLQRDQLKDAVGQYVKLTDKRYMAPMKRLQPMVGDIGRLVKLGRTRALIDFGEEMHTWYVALPSVGTVHDPLAQWTDDLAAEDSLRHFRAESQEEMDRLITDDGDVDKT
jgi:hypothetical protein